MFTVTKILARAGDVVNSAFFSIIVWSLRKIWLLCDIPYGCIYGRSQRLRAPELRLRGMGRVWHVTNTHLSHMLPCQIMSKAVGLSWGSQIWECYGPLSPCDSVCLIQRNTHVIPCRTWSVQVEHFCVVCRARTEWIYKKSRPLTSISYAHIICRFCHIHVFLCHRYWSWYSSLWYFSRHRLYVYRT